MQPTLALIAAVSRNDVIGRGNQLVWHEPEDQKHFRRCTLGCPVIMGRKTWDSLPPRFRPLPGRRNIVLTRQTGWSADGAESADSIDSALSLVTDAHKVFVIGGADVYAQALPRADELVLTEIDAHLDGDVSFPRWDRGAFAEVARDERTSGDGVPFAFVTWQRRPLQRESP
jgi:dihydrofolate reductase